MTSLIKKLSIALVAGVIAAVGFAGPSQATATIAWNGTAPTFAVGSTPAMNINFTPTAVSSSDTFRQVGITVRDSIGQSMALASITSGSLAGCQVTSLTGNHVQVQSNTCNRVNGSPSFNQISVENAGGGGSATAYGAFNIQVPAGLASGLQAGQNYTVWIAITNDSTVIETASLSFSVPAAATTYGANFLANGGSGANPTPQSSNTGTTVMPTTTLTKAGFTFAGWRSGNATVGTVYQPGSSAPLTSNTNFYAQWADSSSSSSSSSSSNGLANTGINSATGISLLVGGASLAVVGAEIILIARRKRSN